MLIRSAMLISWSVLVGRFTMRRRGASRVRIGGIPMPCAVMLGLGICFGGFVRQEVVNGQRTQYHGQTAQKSYDKNHEAAAIAVTV